LVYLVGGNTPIYTELASVQLLECVSDKKVGIYVIPELVKILGEEATARRNAFFPALKTFVLCAESSDLTEMLNSEEILDLQNLLSKSISQYASKVAVQKSLLELFQLLLPTFESMKSLMQIALLFLSSASPMVFL
jgi:hypothetical protein